MITAVPADEAGWADVEAVLGAGAALTDELHPGLPGMSAAAGFVEVTRPTARRAVVRIDL